ncbi:hypothetical protein BC834DRAFT_86934 [Gloeopeniophorella convolvens]|nr:hypothetical protein BC834DRAFT_86934 [Gloeopeniophorella convolvens]
MPVHIRNPDLQDNRSDSGRSCVRASSMCGTTPVAQMPDERTSMGAHPQPEVLDVVPEPLRVSNPPVISYLREMYRLVFQQNHEGQDPRDIDQLRAMEVLEALSREKPLERLPAWLHSKFGGEVPKLAFGIPAVEEEVLRAAEQMGIKKYKAVRDAQRQFLSPEAREEIESQLDTKRMDDEVIAYINGELDPEFGRLKAVPCACPTGVVFVLSWNEFDEKWKVPSRAVNVLRTVLRFEEETLGWYCQSDILSEED